MRDDREATDPVLPQLRAMDAYYTESELISVARIHGVTSALTAPGEGNVISGTAAMVRLDGGTPDEVMIREPVALVINFGEPPKARYGARKKAPMTRMGIAALIRDVLTKARSYREKLAAYESKGQGAPPDRDLKMEALLPVLDGEVPVLARAHRVDDILETLGAIQENAALLHEAGVKIAIQTWIEVYDTLNIRMLPYEAALAVAYGLPWEAAIRALTLSPAEIFGVDDRIGSLRPGLEATLIVTEGDPLQPLTRLRHLMIRGKPVPLTSHHTALYEKWRR
jgi:imidazolonepropionase-like amidohydrolase